MTTTEPQNTEHKQELQPTTRTPLIVGGPLVRCLSKWAQLGDRSIEIKYRSGNGLEERTIWVYDYELEAGKHINIEQDIPTTAELIDIKIERAEANLKNLQKMKREVKHNA